jgi:antitoxin component HigA of HigAB toxin-antitoxin module
MKTLTLVEYLVEHEPDHPLVDMLVAKIAQYEDEAEEFAEFNTVLQRYQVAWPCCVS